MKINGKQTEVETPVTLAELFRKLKVDTVHVAVELNGRIVPKTEFESRSLNAEDEIEVIHFVGGG